MRQEVVIGVQELRELLSNNGLGHFTCIVHKGLSTGPFLPIQFNAYVRHNTLQFSETCDSTFMIIWAKY